MYNDNENNRSVIGINCDNENNRSKLLYSTKIKIFPIKILHLTLYILHG